MAAAFHLCRSTTHPGEERHEHRGAQWSDPTSVSDAEIKARRPTIRVCFLSRIRPADTVRFDYHAQVAAPMG